MLKLKKSQYLKKKKKVKMENYLPEWVLHLESKTNLVTLRKCNSYLQYYKIDFSFNIKLQETNLNISQEYNTEREARRLNRAS